MSCKNLAPELQAWVNNVEAIQAPTQVEEALKDPKWAAVMDEEMMALILKLMVLIIRKLFSPVAKMNTVRVLISLAPNLNCPLKQFDVKNAFLHGYLKEEVYMDFPSRYNAGGKTGVCRL